MANCGTCGSNVSICTCVFANDTDSTTLVIGNGSITSPIAFNKFEGPTPRPLGEIGRLDGEAAVTIPISTQTKIPFTANLTVRTSPNPANLSVDSGMVDLANSRLVCHRAGKYLVGGTLRFNDVTAAADNRRDLRLSMGVPAGANVWAACSAQITTGVAAINTYISPQALVQMAVNDYIEMWAFSTIADNTETGGCALLYAIWMDD